MDKKQATETKKEPREQQGRTSKFYDDALNCRIRELLDSRDTRTEDFAKAVGISSSAVRMWYTGYARPDIEKIPAICKFFNVSADYLLGLSAVPTVDVEIRDFCEKTGLSDAAVLILLHIKKSVGGNKENTRISKLTAMEQLWLVNSIIEDLDAFAMLAGAVNSYVSIRNESDSLEGEGYEGFGMMELFKEGYKKFGPTFNVTVGRETVETLAYLCQSYFLQHIENIAMPAYPLKGWNPED